MHQVVSVFVSMKSQKDPAKEYAFEAFLSHLDPKEHETAKRSKKLAGDFSPDEGHG